MIPKILHFIWVGNKDAFPKYANFIIGEFRSKNPDFDVRLHNFTVDEIIYKASKSKDKMFLDILNNAVNERIRKLKDFLQKTKDGIFDNSNICVNMGTEISNQLRYYYLNTYGGIYCDLDCYPIKPFDNKLLALEKFFMSSMTRRTQLDIFFIGAMPGKFNFINPTILENPFRKDKDNRIEQQKIDALKKHLIDQNKDKIEQFIQQNNIDAYVMHPYIGEKNK